VKVRVASGVIVKVRVKVAAQRSRSVTFTLTFTRHSPGAPNTTGWAKLPPLIATESCFPYGAVRRIRFEGFGR
jgi:hypothetical protein